jgi:hypothetical protein
MIWHDMISFVIVINSLGLKFCVALVHCVFVFVFVLAAMSSSPWSKYFFLLRLNQVRDREGYMRMSDEDHSENRRETMRSTREFFGVDSYEWRRMKLEIGIERDNAVAQELEVFEKDHRHEHKRLTMLIRTELANAADVQSAFGLPQTSIDRIRQFAGEIDLD